MQSIFRNTTKDILLILQPLAVMLITLAMAIINPGLVWWLIIVPIQWLLVVNVINTSLHYQGHWPMFNSKKLNRLYEIFLGLVTVRNFQIYQSAHIKHHKFTNDRPVNNKTKDPVSVFSCGKNGQRELFWSYIVNKANWQALAIVKKRPVIGIPVIDAKLKTEVWSIRGWLIILFLLNPVFAMFMYAVHYLAFCGDAANGYGEHWGALDRSEDTTQNAVGVYNWWFNTFGFNAGYHQEHHHRPAVHWTQLPTVTQELHPDRVIAKGMYIFNNPLWADLKATFKPEPTSTSNCA
jgi:fatty acid desaturase